MQLRYLIVNDNVSISYDNTNDWLYVDWQGEHTPETSYATCWLMVEALRMQPCSKVLNDNSNITYTTAELPEWGKLWLRDMEVAGLQYMAWVLPFNAPKLQTNDLSTQPFRKPLVVTFSDVATAFEWLHKQQRQL
jgi:hypothetical protein